MSKKDNYRKKVLSLSGSGKEKLELKKLEMKHPIDNTLRQSFSHGRSKTVVVEVKKKIQNRTHPTQGKLNSTDKVANEIGLGKVPIVLKSEQESASEQNSSNESLININAKNARRKIVIALKNKILQDTVRSSIVDVILCRHKQLIKQHESARILPAAQTIYFGPPGTGKSFYVRKKIVSELLVNPDCVVEAMFYPEYSYGDFMGKLLPLTVRDESSPDKSRVSYNFYRGHFLHALGKAYKEILFPVIGVPRNVALVIDEINRGNCAAIFGSVFQLLDRDPDGFSSYSVKITEMEMQAIRESIDLLNSRVKMSSSPEAKRVYDIIRNGSIRIPPNLSIVATMNTSDESIYYMDSAFKRRWDWEYTSAGERSVAQDIESAYILNDINVPFGNRWHWLDFVDAINSIILDNGPYIRQVEDKQIGYRFIKAERSQDGMLVIKMSKIKNKVLFFLWDTVFPRNKVVLGEIIGVSIYTYKDLTDNFSLFLKVVEDRMFSMREA